jgi:nitrous oxidase accessory protein NosD
MRTLLKSACWQSACRLLLPGLLMAWGILPGLASETVLTVGQGQTYALPSDAARAAGPGDIVRIFPGTYADCATWLANGLVIEGTGPNVVFAGKICAGKAIFITTGNDITIRNITFTAAHAEGHNGAGIRAEGANLTVEDSRFLDNENGILAGANPASTIEIRNSTFRGNGNCIAACAHGIYAGHIALLRVENSQFEKQHVGHHIKSRAARTEIIHNRVQDGPEGSSSYLVDLPNGGSAVISGNVFEKGPNSSNKRTAIAIGAEKETNPAGDILIEDNSFTNNSGVATVFVRNYTGRAIALVKNRLPGNVTPIMEPAQEDKARP